MGNIRHYKQFVCDFETTVYPNQEFTEVWAAAAVEIGTENVSVFNSIGAFYDYIKSLKCHVVCYFHNLKFDGEFLMSYFINVLKMKQASYTIDNDLTTTKFFDTADMPNNTFKYLISDTGQWYGLTVKTGKHIIDFRDSMKLLPFSVEDIGKSFKTKHQKLSIEYSGLRYAGGIISDDEKQYIMNDVLVVAEALQTLFLQGHKKLTIGSCCLSEYKKTLGFELFDKIHPNLYSTQEYNIGKHHNKNYSIDFQTFGAATAGEYVRNAYRGGWCYVAPGKANRIYHNGITLDVNSLYPSMMHSQSGNVYPVGDPTFWTGDFIPDIALTDSHYYFVRFECRFNIKPGYLPFVQEKNSGLYRINQMLTTSDVFYRGRYYDEYVGFDGAIKPAKILLTMTQTDFDLFREHYDITDLKILDGCYFNATQGIFDYYINKYKEIKQKSKGAVRTLAKLFLNNLYGKMSASTDSSYKIAFSDPKTKIIRFFSVMENDKTPGYIPIGAAVTSYARSFTIRAAQQNYYGPDNPGFIYADTDSLHMDIPPENIRGCPIDDVEFCKWKIESQWDNAIFVRQKTYIEHLTHNGIEKLQEPEYNVVCAGMPDRCKNILIRSLAGDKPCENDSADVQEFLKTQRDLADFKVGLAVPGKLYPHRIRGGIVLLEDDYRLR